MGLGDAVARALEAVGVTEDRVARWLARECAGCRRRREKLNDLGHWAARVLRGRTDRAAHYLEELLRDD